MKRTNKISLFGALVIAAVLKTTLVASGRVPFNADEAIVALMARHILQGHRPIFFYGQAYMGSLDAYLVAFGFYWFGEHVWVVRMIQALLFLGTMVTTGLIGKIALGSWRIGVLAAWFLAIPSVNVTLYTTTSLGGYGEMLLIGNLILILGVGITNQLINGEKSKIKQWSWVGLGFLSGFGLWVFGLTLVYSLPILLFLIWRIWKDQSSCNFRQRFVSLAFCMILLGFGFILGALPWGLYAFENGFTTLLSELTGSAIAGAESGSPLVSLTQHIINLVIFGGTVITGLRPPWGLEWLAPPLLPAALAFWMGVIAFTLVRFVKSISSSFSVNQSWNRYHGRSHRRQTPSDLVFSHLGILTNQASVSRFSDKFPEKQAGFILLVSVGLTLLLGFIATPYGADPSGRYFIPLAVLMSLFAAMVIINLRDAYGRWLWGLVGLILGFNLWGTIQAANNFPPGLTTQFDAVTRIDQRYDFDLMTFLEEQGESLGYTSYWISYPLAFKSGERLIFVPRLPYHGDLRYTSRDDRYEPYAQKVAKANKVAYITGNQPTLEVRIRQGLTDLDVDWKENEIGDYHVFYQLSRLVRPDDLGLGGETE